MPTRMYVRKYDVHTGMYILVVKIVMFIFVLLFGSAVCYIVLDYMSSSPWDVCPFLHGMYACPLIHGMYVLSSTG